MKFLEAGVSLTTMMLMGSLINAKIYSKCELAGALLALGIRGRDIPRWVCIAHFETELNSNVIGQHIDDGSWDHGLWQISDKYWVGRDRPGGKCGYSGAQVRGDDLVNAVNCVKRILNETLHTEYDPWLAWPVYAVQGRCKGNVHYFVANCFLT